MGARGHRTSNTAGSLNQDKVHIDSMKKKLIADQIRQRMQSKTSPPGSGKKRGRGRPPKISNDSSPPNELNDVSNFFFFFSHDKLCLGMSFKFATKLLEVKLNGSTLSAVKP